MINVSIFFSLPKPFNTYFFEEQPKEVSRKLDYLTNKGKIYLSARFGSRCNLHRISILFDNDILPYGSGTDSFLKELNFLSRNMI